MNVIYQAAGIFVLRGACAAFALLAGSAPAWAQVRVWNGGENDPAVQSASYDDADEGNTDGQDSRIGLATLQQPRPPAAGNAPRTAPPRTNPPAPPRQSAPPRRPAPSDDEFAFGGESRYLGSARAPGSVAPNMIGDFFGGAGQIFFLDSESGQGTQFAANIPSAGGTRRFKIADGNSPIPTDRVYFLYNHFQNAIGPAFGRTTDLDVDRYTPAFEKTFWDGTASIDVRIPIGYTQNSEVFLFGNGDAKDTEFGNIGLTLKFLLWTTGNTAVAGGLGLNLPTANDVDIFLNNPGGDFHINNESVHVMPYLGFFSQLDENWFAQGFFQLDLDGGGNTVSSAQSGTLGVLNEQNLLYMDVSLGYWLFRDAGRGTITGIAPTLEVHYATSLQDSDFVVDPQSFVGFGNVFNRFDVIDLTAGLTIRIGQLSTLAVGVAAPLKARDDERFFDAEILVQFNRYF